MQAKKPRAFGKMPVVADVHAHAGVTRVEHGVPEVTGLEEVLFPKTRGLWNVILAVFPKIAAIGIKYSRGIVIHARHLAFVHRHHHGHVVLLGQRREFFERGSRHGFGEVVPARILAGAEIRAVEDLLQPQYLHPALASFVNERQMLLEHGRGDFFDRARFVVDGVAHLNQPADDLACHNLFSMMCD